MAKDTTKKCGMSLDNGKRCRRKAVTDDIGYWMCERCANNYARIEIHHRLKVRWSMENFDACMRRYIKGITAAVALTILLSGISYATERKGESARKSPTDKVGIQNGITLDTHTTRPSTNRSTTRSARPKGGKLLPLDYLLLEITNGSSPKRERQTGGTVGGQYSYPMWLPSTSWPATQRYPRIPRYNLSQPTSPVGGQVWVHTVEHPNGVKEIEIRNIYGQPVHWSVETNTWATYGLLATD